MASLFGLAAAHKFLGGYNMSVNFIAGAVKDTFLPGWLVQPYAYALPVVEAIIPLWLLSGIKLKEGWLFTGIVLITLAFGLTASKQNGTDIFIYLLMTCAGLYASQFDALRLGGKSNK